MFAALFRRSKKYKQMTMQYGSIMSNKLQETKCYHHLIPAGRIYIFIINLFSVGMKKSKEKASKFVICFHNQITDYFLFQLENRNRKAVSLNSGSLIKNRVDQFFWQMVLSKLVLTPVLNYAEFVIDEFDNSLSNTRGIMIGIDLSTKTHATETTPAWIGLDTGWGKSNLFCIDFSSELTFFFEQVMLLKVGRCLYQEHECITLIILFQNLMVKEMLQVTFYSLTNLQMLIDIFCTGVLVDFKDMNLAFFVNNEFKGIEPLSPAPPRLDNFSFACACAHGKTTVSIRIPQYREHCIRTYNYFKEKTNFSSP